MNGTVNIMRLLVALLRLLAPNAHRRLFYVSAVGICIGLWVLLYVLIIVGVVAEAAEAVVMVAEVMMVVGAVVTFAQRCSKEMLI